MMEQYLQALRGRDGVSEEVLLELEERFKEPEQEPVEVVPAPTLEERVIKMAEQLLTTQMELEIAQEALDFILMGGM